VKSRRLWIGGTALAAVIAFGATWVLTAPASENRQAAEETVGPVDTLDITFNLPSLDGPPRLPGAWSWWELRGGECLAATPQSDSSTVTVVSCDTHHLARYSNPTLLSPDRDAPYPGERFLAEQATSHCGKIDAGDVGGGPDLSDLAVSGIYSAGESSWEEGLRVVGCIVFRLSGDAIPLTPPGEEPG
jgi:hypothetical protein